MSNSVRPYTQPVAPFSVKSRYEDAYTPLVARGASVMRCKGSPGCPSCTKKTVHPLGLCVSCFRRTFGIGRSDHVPRWDDTV